MANSGRNQITHAYCDNCVSIKPVQFEGYVYDSKIPGFIGGDITCDTCAWIVAVLFQPVEVSGEVVNG